MFHIEHSLLKSRFSRVKPFLDSLKNRKDLFDKDTQKKIKKDFDQLNKNFFDPRFPVRPDSSFTKIIDLSRNDSLSFGGVYDPKCFSHLI